MNWDLLLRYRGHECSPAERARCDAWLAADPRHRVVLDAIVVGADRALRDGGRVVGDVAAARRRRLVPWTVVAAAAAIGIRFPIQFFTL